MEYNDLPSSPSMTFDEVKDLLAVRVWHADFIDEIREADELLFERDIPGTVSVLVYDMPEAVQSVPRSQTKMWGKTHAELFAHGIANTLTLYPLASESTTLGDGTVIYAFFGDDVFAATRTLALDHYPECVGAYGALVGIPTRHTALCYPIETMDVVKAASSLIQIIDDLYTNEEGATSPGLFWYHDGRFTELPYIIEGNELNFYPPEAFMQLLNQLAEK